MRWILLILLADSLFFMGVNRMPTLQWMNLAIPTMRYLGVDTAQLTPLPLAPHAENLPEGPVQIEGPEYRDERPANVARVLGNRPLSAWADEMVRVADDYGLDYRLIPAISIQESGGGQHLCASYNAWGIGGRNCWAFASWRDGIEVAAKILSAPLYTSRSIHGKLCVWVAGDDYCSGYPHYANIVLSLMEDMK